MTLLQEIRDKRAFICDMDGVIYHGRKVLPGAKPFVNWLKKNEKPFLFLTNSAERTPQQLSDRLAVMGISVGPDHFMTSAIATASFLQNQSPGAKVYAIGENGLLEAATATGVKRVIAWQIAQEMKAQKLSKTALAARMNTSRAALNRLLDADDASLTLNTLSVAAAALGKRLRVELIPT